MTPTSVVYQDVCVIVYDGVYNPAEDTQLLCDHLEVAPNEHLLEIGTGCGLVAIVAARFGAHVVATDNSPLAVQNAQENINRYNLQKQVEVRLGHLFEPIRSSERFQVIVFNPPYLPGNPDDIAFDPTWIGGPTGREIIDSFLTQCPQYLHKGGRLLLVQSSLSDPARTQQMLSKRFQEVRVKTEKRFFFEQVMLFEAKTPVNG